MYPGIKQAPWLCLMNRSATNYLTRAEASTAARMRPCLIGAAELPVSAAHGPQLAGNLETATWCVKLLTEHSHKMNSHTIFH